MIALLQRVSRSSVTVAGQTIGRVGRGLMVLVCAERGDNEKVAIKLLDRVIRYRVFEDDRGRMNRSLDDLNHHCDAAEAHDRAGLLLVPQFTLAADTRSGLRPSFTPAAPPDQASALFDCFATAARERLPGVQTGQFGADMQVELVNDGPVTIWLQLQS